MQAFLSILADFVEHRWARSTRIGKALANHPGIKFSLDAPADSIDEQSIIRWDELGRPPYQYWPRRELGSLMGWRQRDRYSYGSFMLHRPEYAQIGQQQIDDNWVCDITDVHGFSASKSELRDFASTDLMVEANSRDMIDEITHEKLTKNLAHREIRILHVPGCDYFHRYSWDGRIFLINSGGSHHFAAAKYIAARLPESVPLRGKLYTYSLNALAIASLRRDFEMFVISDDATISLGFHDAMEAFRATWLWNCMPRPFENAKAILLPKAERRSMVVADLLRKAGATDLGVHLTAIAAATLFRPDAITY